MRNHRIILISIACAFVAWFCIGAASAPEKQGGRFLFLVDISSAMDGNKTALRRSIRSVVESGLNGQMQYGDTIGLWTYNDKLNAGFPMVIWRREHVQDITNAIDFWMSKQKFGHHSDFPKVTPLLQSVIKSSQKLTIIWISAGNDKLTGTPFDSSIDELHKEFRDDFRKQHIPFVTLLAVRKGVVTDFTVNPGDAKLRLPAIMEKEAEEAKVAASNPPPSQTVAPAAPKKPSLIIKVGPSPELVEQRKEMEAAKAQANVAIAVAAPKTNTNAVVAAPATASTNTLAAVTTKPAVVPPTNAAAPVQTNVVTTSNAPAPAVTPAPVAVVPKPIVVVTSAPAPVVATNAAVASNAAAIATPVIKAPPVQEPTPTPTVAVTTQTSTIWIAIGAGVLVLVGGIILLVMKQAAAPKGPSFISQSMTRDHFNSDASKPSSDKQAGHG